MKTDAEVEQEEVEALYGHRLNTTEFLSGEELSIKAIEELRRRREQQKKITDDE